LSERGNVEWVEKRLEVSRWFKLIDLRLSFCGPRAVDPNGGEVERGFAPRQWENNKGSV